MSFEKPKKTELHEVTPELGVEQAKESLENKKGKLLIDLGIEKAVLEALIIKWSPENKKKEASNKEFWGDKIEQVIGPYIDKAAKLLGLETGEDSERFILARGHSRIAGLEAEISSIDSLLEKLTSGGK